MIRASSTAELARHTAWPLDRIKDHSSKIGSGITPTGGATSYLNAGVPLLRSQNVHFDGLRLDDVAFIGEDTHAEMAGTQLKAGDVLLNITGASIGRCTFIPEGFGEGNVNQHVCIIRPSASLDHRFLTYCLAASWGQDQIQSSFTGASRQGLGQRDLGEIQIPLPARAEQERIVAYLDASCAAIDAAVAAKRRQLEMLEAISQSVIQTAVTKGIDNNVELIESGIQWMERVPLKWKKHKMFRICKKISSGGTPLSTNLDYYGGNIAWVQTGDLNDNYIELTEKTITELGLEESSAKIFPKDTLLVAMYGATIGKLGILLKQSATNQACCAMQFQDSVRNKYIFYLLLGYRPTIIGMAYGGGQPNISQEIIKQLYFFLPSYDEQTKIVAHLDSKCAQIEDIKNNIKSQIHILRKYRKSLIHECVTGQRRVTVPDIKRVQAHG